MPTAPKTFRMHGTSPRRIPQTVSSAERPGGQWLHSRRWRAARKHHLSLSPLCVHCQAEGRYTMATQVDHITAHKGNYELFWDERNWQSLCAPCHSRKTCREDGGFGNGQGVGQISVHGRR